MRILIAEDERDLNHILTERLRKEHYSVDACFDGQEALDYLEGAEYDALILDIMMPVMDGLTVLKKLRSRGNSVPVLLLTAKDSIEDRVNGLDAGANDYLVKPFSMAVLLKHVEAVLRRTQGEKEVFLYRGLTIDPERKQVAREGEEIRLTPREYALLDLLARNRGRVLTKTMILEQVWDNQGAFVEENTVNVTLNRLKKKIEPDPENPVYIRNVFGLGYTFGD